MVSAFVCVEARDWEGVIRGVAQYLSDGKAMLAHVVDERASRGYELALRGLLGRGAQRGMDAASREAALGLLADAAALPTRSCGSRARPGPRDLCRSGSARLTAQDEGSRGR